MCGINGFLTSVNTNELDLIKVLNDCTNKIIHRGPDSTGIWADDKKGIYMGHRRLSIVDLSPTGAQPMSSNGGRYVICLNGEIYNHLELRDELSLFTNNIIWKGSSDTETLINCFEFWGIEATLKKTTGMFAFSLWDNFTDELTIGRDRFGEKPLYYGWQENAFFFSSELKSIKANPLFKSEIDRNALGLYVKYAYVPAPYSIYKNIYKLSPGSFLSVSLNSKNSKPSIYWSSLSQMKGSYENPFTGNKDQAVEQLNILLTKAVKKQMMADVPLGAFLSGGIDSSVVVAIMQSLSNAPIKTYTIGFKEDGYNEAHFAKKVAEHIGTDHTELYVTEKDALSVIPQLPYFYDEPFADSSQIPTYLVSKLASESVTVSLSGDAADELFGGYNRYLLANNLWKKISIFPIGLRQIISNLLTSVSPQTYNSFFNFLSFNTSYSKKQNVGDKIHKSMGVLTSSSYLELYDRITSSWYEPSNIVIGVGDFFEIKEALPPQIDSLDPISKMMAMDLISYLPDDILCKVDRAAMATSLETRVPFLDQSVMQFAWSLPLDYKIFGKKSKWVLREVLYKYVPKKLIDRPKMGFGVPIDTWLRGDLRDWAEKLLNEDRLLQEGYFNPQPIRKKWEEHLSGKRNWQHQLWVILMFQSWLEQNK
jgi:asparagine synthase (glutamine-hydrolysing)